MDKANWTDDDCVEVLGTFLDSSLKLFPYNLIWTNKFKRVVSEGDEYPVLPFYRHHRSSTRKKHLGSMTSKEYTERMDILKHWKMELWIRPMENFAFKSYDEELEVDLYYHLKKELKAIAKDGCKKSFHDASLWEEDWMPVESKGVEFKFVFGMFFNASFIAISNGFSWCSRAFERNRR